MSVPQPTPNNLTLVKYGPLAVDFTVTGTYDLGNINCDENTFIPLNATIVLQNALGTNSTPAAVIIDNGTTGENITVSNTLPTTPVQTTLGATGNLSQIPLTLAANGYVLGQIPVANPNPALNASPSGAASTQNLRVNVTANAVPALTSISRSTTNNISTIVVSSIPTWLVAGVGVKVIGIGTSAYNGFVTVLSVTSTTFSYYNPSITTDASANDNGGRIGALYGDVYVVGLLQ